MWQSSPALILLLILSGIGTFMLAIYLFQKRRMPEAKTLWILMAAAAFWCFTYMLELGSTDLAAKLFWAKVKYFGILLVPPSWLILALQYTGRDKWLTPRFIALLSIMPIVNLILLWTTDLLDRRNSAKGRRIFGPGPAHGAGVLDLRRVRVLVGFDRCRFDLSGIHAFQSAVP
jgi:hypothetical protein